METQTKLRTKNQPYFDCLIKTPIFLAYQWNTILLSEPRSLFNFKKTVRTQIITFSTQSMYQNIHYLHQFYTSFITSS